MSDIFLSYASQDRPRAQELAETLSRYGWSVWWDRQIPPGKTFDQVIEEELNVARCVVVLWSQESVLSRWVKTEASTAAQRDILVPALIDDVTIPLEFRLIQAARLVDWRSGVSHPDFDLFVQAIARTLREKPRPQPSESWWQAVPDFSSVLKGKGFFSQSWRQAVSRTRILTKKMLIALAVLIAILGVIALLVDETPVPFTPPVAPVANAQYCCDWTGVRRCVLTYPVPVGSQCVCYGQGSGVACP
jgi:hypothetical protein